MLLAVFILIVAGRATATISCLTGCCEHLIVEVKTGLPFDSDGVDALTGLMRQYLTDLALVARQRIRAAEHIQQFSCYGIADGLAQAMSACVRNKGAASC